MALERGLQVGGAAGRVGKPDRSVLTARSRIVA